MYQIYVDDLCIYDSKSSSLSCKVIDPSLTMGDNAAGSLEFKMLPSNIGYNKLKKLTSVVLVREDGHDIWSGRVISENENFYKQRSITCEGALAYFNDTIQPPAEYHDISPRELLKTFINIHNSQVETSKQFQIGAVTVKDPNDSLYRYTNYETTWECIEDKLLNRLGGHIYIRRADKKMYIDWIEDYLSVNTQIIDFGKNLMDFTKNFDMTDLVTVIVPRGERLEESPIQALDAYLTVKDVNNGSIFVENEEAVSQYGRITKVVDWDDVTDPVNLLRKAQLYLEDQQFDKVELEVSAIDLHYLNPKIETIKVLDKIRCRSLPHGMDRYFPVTEVSIKMDKPDQTTYILGDSTEGSLTDINNTLNGQITNQIDANTAFENKRADNIVTSTDEKIAESNKRTDDLIGNLDKETNASLEAVNKRIDTTNSTIEESSRELNERMDEEAKKAKEQTDKALQEAKDNASEILRLATNGFITIVSGENGTEALIVSETQDVTKAQKFWKWNVNGLGYTKDGGKTYGLAITMDGSIVADYITTGNLDAGVIKTGILEDINGNTSFNLTTGYLKMSKGAINIGDGIFMVDELGNVAMSKGSINIADGKFSVTKNGYMTATYGKIANFNISTNSIYNDKITLDNSGVSIKVDNNYFGHIGTNHYKGHPEIVGVNIDAYYTSYYLGIAAQKVSGGNLFWRLVYINRQFANYIEGTIAFGCDADFHNFRALNCIIDPDTGGAAGGITRTLKFQAPYSIDDNGGIQTWGEVIMTFKNGFLIDCSWADT